MDTEWAQEIYKKQSKTTGTTFCTHETTRTHNNLKNTVYII
ncbi:hypothetical protein [Methanobrevibacter oralis]|nr:hypothetical protein [Methanobrevibacter oralis]